MLNIPTKTAGGIQLWTDHLVRGGFRLQQHALTGHWRLLDDRDVRRAWGSKTHCAGYLTHLADDRESAPPSKHIVVLLHGLLRTARCMRPMQTSFKSAGFDTVIRFAYASTRSSIADHATALREVLQDYPEGTQFSFVGHSMGSIVVRHLVSDLRRDGDPPGILSRCRSLVMLGPPNQGAAIARRLAPTGLYRVVTGKGGMELGPWWDDFTKRLATPDFPFLIIAGDLSENRLRNPLVDRSGDYLVSVAEAKLEGSEAFYTLPIIHSRLMKDKKSIEISIDFVKQHS